jgi:antitoxin VapB
MSAKTAKPFEGKKVLARRDSRTGDVILSRKPDSWDGLSSLYDKGEVPNNFMSDADRGQSDHDRDPFANRLE